MRAERELFPESVIPDERDLEIAEVFARWIDTKTVSLHTEQVYREGIRRFLEWVEARGCRKWSDLSRGALQEYLGTLRQYQANYKKNLWKPIRGASLWASLEWPDAFRDVAARIQIKTTTPQFPDDKTALTLVEAAEFCEALAESEEGRRILPGVALQALAGLRLTEAFRLQWSSVHLETGIVIIQGQVKGRDSVRRVPVPNFVLDVLEATPRSEERILAEYCDFRNYGHAVAKCLKRWRPDLKLEPKGLRRTLESEAARRGWAGYAFNRFLGRAPGSIAERHYISVGSDLVDLLREQVTERINEILAPYRRRPTQSGGNVIQLRFG